MPVFEMPLDQLKTYKGCSPRPGDFDKYWEDALADLASTGLDHELKESEYDVPGVLCYDLYFTGVKGARIHSKFLRPEKIEGKIPAIAIFHGYYHHSGEWFERLPYALSGMAVLVMEARGQGGTSEDVYSGVGPTVFGHVVRGVRDEDPHKLYYRDVYLDGVKAVKILMGMDFIDENRIAVSGESQGGGISLAVSGLVPKIKLAAPIYPFLGDFKRVFNMDLDKGAYEGIYWYFKKCDPTHEHENEFFERLGYIDTQNFAPKIKAKILWQTGLMDDTCPPSTQFATYNKITSEKKMITYYDHTHELIYFANDEIYKFFSKEL